MTAVSVIGTFAAHHGTTSFDMPQLCWLQVVVVVALSVIISLAGGSIGGLIADLAQ